MKLKLCQQCKRPYLSKEDFCPHCPPPVNAESLGTLGCILLTILPLFLMMLFWLFFFFGMFMK